MQQHSVFAAAWAAGEIVAASLDEPAVDDAPATLVETLADAAPAHDAAALARVEVARLLRTAGLTPRERLVLSVMYGLRVQYGPTELAAALHVSLQAVTLCQRRALAKLRETAAAGR